MILYCSSPKYAFTLKEASHFHTHWWIGKRTCIICKYRDTVERRKNVGREGEVTNLKQEGNVLDVALSPVFLKRNLLHTLSFSMWTGLIWSLQSTLHHFLPVSSLYPSGIILYLFFWYTASILFLPGSLSFIKKIHQMSRDSFISIMC